MIRAKDLLLLHSQPPANTKEPQKERQRQKYKKLPNTYNRLPLCSHLPVFSPSYLCELLAATEFLSEGVELRRDLLVGPSQLAG